MMQEIRARRSIRKYEDKHVDDELILQLIESARIAPSGSNTQPWHFIVIRSEETRKMLAKVSHHQNWMVSAPVYIVCVADIRCRLDGEAPISLDEDSPQQELKQIIRDTSIAIEHIVLESNHLGLGACWVGWFTQEEIRPVLNIPADKYVVGVLTIGYAGENPNSRPRKKLEEIIHYEKW